MWFTCLDMSYKEVSMICCQVSVMSNILRVSIVWVDAWVFLCSLDVSADLWGTALHPQSAWNIPPKYSDAQHSFSPFLSPTGYPSTKIPQHHHSHISALCMILKSFCPILSGTTVLLCSPCWVHCHTFQFWLSREISWLVLAGLKLVLAGLYWQYSGLWVQTRDVSCSTLRWAVWSLSIKSLIKDASILQ